MAVALSFVNSSLALYPTPDYFNGESSESNEDNGVTLHGDGFVTALERRGKQYRVVKGAHCGWCDSEDVKVLSFPAFFVINDTLQATIKARLLPSAQCEEGAIYLEPGDLVCAFEQSNNWLKIKVAAVDQFYWLLKATSNGIELALPAVPSLFKKSPHLPADAVLRKRSRPSITDSVVVDEFSGTYIVGVKVVVEEREWVWVCDSSRSFMLCSTPDKSTQLIVEANVSHELSFLELSLELPAGSSLRLRKHPDKEAAVAGVVGDSDIIAVRADYATHLCDDWTAVLMEPFVDTWCLTQVGSVATLTRVAVDEREHLPSNRNGAAAAVVNPTSPAPVLPTNVSNNAQSPVKRINIEDAPIVAKGTYSFQLPPEAVEDVQSNAPQLAPPSQRAGETALLPKPATVEKSLVSGSDDDVETGIESTMQHEREGATNILGPENDCENVAEDRTEGSAVVVNINDDNIGTSNDDEDIVDEPTQTRDSKISPVMTPPRQTRAFSTDNGRPLGNDETPIVAKGVYMLDGEVLTPAPAATTSGTATKKRSPRSHKKKTSPVATKKKHIPPPIFAGDSVVGVAECLDDPAETAPTSTVPESTMSLPDVADIDDRDFDMGNELMYGALTVSVDDLDDFQEDGEEHLVGETLPNEDEHGTVRQSKWDVEEKESDRDVEANADEEEEGETGCLGLLNEYSMNGMWAGMHILPEQGLEDIYTMELAPLMAFMPAAEPVAVGLAELERELEDGDGEMNCLAYLDLLPTCDIEAMDLNEEF